jgi:hypothetical protein
LKLLEFDSKSNYKIKEPEYSFYLNLPNSSEEVYTAIGPSYSLALCEHRSIIIRVN